VSNKLIRYSRTFEQKELSVRVAKADELKKFYRLIAGDERNTVVLKAAKSAGADANQDYWEFSGAAGSTFSGGVVVSETAEGANA
jgi:hypothetical protein